ncbi:hypothetical protein LINPERHAP2_LOCUS38587 [Linum perenne]
MHVCLACDCACGLELVDDGIEVGFVVGFDDWNWLVLNEEFEHDVDVESHDGLMLGLDGFDEEVDGWFWLLGLSDE